MHPQREGAVQTAAYADRLALLQVELHDAVRALSRAAVLASSGEAVTAAHYRVLDVLGGFVGAWEGLVALQEKLEEVCLLVLCCC